MAYTTPVMDATVGGSFSAAQYHTYVRDNFAESAPGCFTAKGQLQIGSGIDTYTNLTVGTSTYVMTSLAAAATGLLWKVDPTVDVLTTKGDLPVGTGMGTSDRLQVGATNGDLLSPLAVVAPHGMNYLTARPFYCRYVCASGDAAGRIDFETLSFESADWVATGSSWALTVPANYAGYYLVTAGVKTAAANDSTEEITLSLYKNNTLYTHLASIKCSGVSVFSPVTSEKWLSGSAVVYLSATHYIHVQCSEAVVATGGNYYNHIGVLRLGVT